MESGLQELKFSRYNQKVELSGKLFLYNALTGGYASIPIYIKRCGQRIARILVATYLYASLLYRDNLLYILFGREKTRKWGGFWCDVIKLFVFAFKFGDF